MNTVWLEKVAKNIFPLSKEQKDLKQALSEWIYEGYFNDLETSSETCQICDHPDIRYQFEIHNRNTGNVLLIGSECVTRFGGITVVDQEGKIIGSREAKKKVAQDKHKLIKYAQTNNVINSLVALGVKDQEFDISDFVQYYQERKAFTPNQLSTIIWRLEKHTVQFNKAHFKLTIKRGREKQQLFGMESWKLEKIYPCLSSSQKGLLKAHLNRKAT